MNKAAKVFILGLVSLVTLAFAVAPSQDAVLATDIAAADLAAVQPSTAEQQTVSANTNSIETKALDVMLAMSEVGSALHNFDVAAAIALAESEVGTSRPTGWSQPGECIVSVMRWLDAGGADLSKVGSDPVSSYTSALRLTMEVAQPGDVVQYEHVLFPTSWESGVHTLLITEVNDDGTFTIIQSNVPGGSGLVTKVENWVPSPPDGFISVVWRF